MKPILFALLLTLAGCTSFNPTAVGEKAGEAEQALCPLTTAQNLDTAFTKIMQLVPFFNEWKPVCEQD